MYTIIMILGVLWTRTRLRFYPYYLIRIMPAKGREIVQYVFLSPLFAKSDKEVFYFA